MDLGTYMSAFEILKELEIFDEAASCLFGSGKISMAERYIDEVIEKHGKTPDLLCLLGDIRKNEDLYIEAWEKSNHKCSKAQRLLGRTKFNRGDYEGAILSFNLALKINKLYGNTWYTLGCAYMRTEKWGKAVFAFGNVVSLDSSKGEAWSNIASIYMAQKKNKEALVCLEQAVKLCKTHWKIWENLIMLCIDSRKF